MLYKENPKLMYFLLIWNKQFNQSYFTQSSSQERCIVTVYLGFEDSKSGINGVKAYVGADIGSDHNPGIGNLDAKLKRTIKSNKKNINML